MVDAPGQLPIGIRGWSSGFGRRRITVAAGIAAVTATLLLSGPGLAPGWGIASLAHAQTAGRPGSFADVVEKVKPAVISVRVKFATTKRTRDGASDTRDKPSD